MDLLFALSKFRDFHAVVNLAEIRPSQQFHGFNVTVTDFKFIVVITFPEDSHKKTLRSTKCCYLLSADDCVLTFTSVSVFFFVLS